MSVTPPASAATAPSAALVPRPPMDAALRALGDPGRFRILAALSGPERRMVVEIAEKVRRDPSIVSKHLGILLKAQLVARDRAGLYRIPEHLQPDRAQPIMDLGFCLLRFHPEADNRED